MFQSVLTINYAIKWFVPNPIFHTFLARNVNLYCSGFDTLLNQTASKFPGKKSIYIYIFPPDKLCYISCQCFSWIFLAKWKHFPRNSGWKCEVLSWSRFPKSWLADRQLGARPSSYGIETDWDWVRVTEFQLNRTLYSVKSGN